jgi:hypothetical protein
MDSSAFDTLTRLIGTSRRDLLRAAGVSALGALGLAAVLDDEAEAKKGGRKRRRRRCKPKPAGSACQTDKDCCIKKTKRECGVLTDEEGAPTVCCGVAGTSCGTSDDCCFGFTCVDGACVEAT